MFKFNITPKDCKFIVKKDERKVICILEQTELMFIVYALENLNVPIDTISFCGNKQYDKLYNRLRMPNQFIGIATCSPDDEFDEELGRLIAFGRMKDKLNKSFFKRANTIIDTYDEWLDEAAFKLNTLGAKLSQNSDHRNDVIAERLGLNDKEKNELSQDK